MFKKLRCKHENLQTVTNIHGEAIYHCGYRSIKNCIDCGKEFKGGLDEDCTKSNEFQYKEFHLKAKSLGEVSDGSHTFNELYHHRMMLFAVICNVYREHAWKSWKHHDGTMFDDYFIVGVNTPQGQYSYHYHKDNWNYFNVTERPNAPEWDGHKPCDVERLLSLNSL